MPLAGHPPLDVSHQAAVVVVVFVFRVMPQAVYAVSFAALWAASLTCGVDWLGWTWPWAVRHASWVAVSGTRVPERPPFEPSAWAEAADAPAPTIMNAMATTAALRFLFVPNMVIPSICRRVSDAVNSTGCRTPTNRIGVDLQVAARTVSVLCKTLDS